MDGEIGINNRYLRDKNIDFNEIGNLGAVILTLFISSPTF